MWFIKAKSWMKLVCMCLVAVWAGCEAVKPPSEEVVQAKAAEGQAVTLSAEMAEALSAFNRGAALLEQYKYADAAESLERVMAVAPDWSAARFNLGLAYLNMQEDASASDSLALAQKAFEDVLAAEPNHLSARFCLGLYYQHLAQNAEALACFEAVAAADSQDPYVLYKQAETLFIDENVSIAPIYYYTYVRLYKPWVTPIISPVTGDPVAQWKIDWEAKQAARGE